MLFVPAVWGFTYIRRQNFVDETNWFVFFILVNLIMMTLAITFIGGLCANSNGCRWAFYWAHLIQQILMISFYLWNGLNYEVMPMYGTGNDKMWMGIAVTLTLDSWLTSMIGSWCNQEDKSEIGGVMPLVNMSSSNYTDRETAALKN